MNAMNERTGESAQSDRIWLGVAREALTKPSIQRGEYAGAAQYA